MIRYVATADGRFLGRGQLRHSEGEHRMLVLDRWHELLRNLERDSWTVSGRFD
jgi:hypothetical protein